MKLGDKLPAWGCAGLGGGGILPSKLYSPTLIITSYLSVSLPLLPSFNPVAVGINDIWETCTVILSRKGQVNVSRR